MNAFKKHNPLINAYAQESSENLQDMVMMVVLSIQQPWYQVGIQMVDYKAHGLDSRFVWGNKSNTLKWLHSNADSLYTSAMQALENERGRELDVALMDVFLKVDGLGLAKAGFCCQLFAGRVGCIDVHNLRRLSIPETVLKFSKKVKPLTRRKKIEAYVDACRQRRCSWLWDSWCNLIADKQPDKWKNGTEVSRVHLDYLLV
jgi:hypothetical protein